MESILAACAVADPTGDWTSLRFLITWRGCPADDVWDVPLSAFGASAKDSLAAADAVLQESYAHFAYLGIPASAFRCETLLKVIYVNWKQFNGTWLGAPAAVALASARQQRLSRVADSFGLVTVPPMSDAAFRGATGRAPEFEDDWVNPNKPAKAAKAAKAAKPKADKAAKAAAKPKATPKAKLPKVAKPKKAAAAAAKPVKALPRKTIVAERKKPGPKPKAKPAPAPAADDDDDDVEDVEDVAPVASEEEDDDEEEFVAPKKAAKSAGGAGGATPKRKPGRPPKVQPVASTPAEAAKYAATLMAAKAKGTPAKRAADGAGASPAKKRGRPSNADRAAAAAAAAATADSDDEDDSSS